MLKYLKGNSKAIARWGLARNSFAVPVRGCPGRTGTAGINGGVKVSCKNY